MLSRAPSDCGPANCKEADILRALMLMARGLEGKQSKHLTVNEFIGSEQGDPEGVCFSLAY